MASRKNAFFEATKAAFPSFSRGLVKGAILGVGIGIVAAGFFAASAALVPGIFAAGGAFEVMAGFVPLHVQMFFNAGITAAVMSVTESYNIARDTYEAVREENAAGLHQAHEAGKQAHSPYNTVGPKVDHTHHHPGHSQSNAIKAIIERGSHASHSDMIQQQAALAAAEGRVH